MVHIEIKITSFINNFFEGKISQGASTITQQLVRLQFLNNKKTYSRKTKEIVLALSLEKKLSKERILELYLNSIYLGNRAYGIEAASRRYFNKKTVVRKMCSF